MRGWIILLSLAAGCDSGTKGAKPTVAPAVAASTPTEDAAVAVPVDAAVLPEPARIEAVEPVPARRTQPAAVHSTSIEIPDHATTSFAGIDITYRSTGHGDSDQGWGATGDFIARRGSETQTVSLSYFSDSPGDLAEVALLGEAFEVRWPTSSMTLTYLGKARPAGDHSCYEVVPREAKAMGIVSTTPNAQHVNFKLVGALGAGMNSGVVTMHEYRDWAVHCGTQSLRVWVTPKTKAKAKAKAKR